jgi:hypothetical protein
MEHAMLNRHRMNKTTLYSFAALGGALAIASVSYATPYGGIEFPDGPSSFADSVISYDPAFGGGNVPTHANFITPGKAIGIPDYSGGGSGTGSVSLGAGGQIILKFTDNFLTGSGTAGKDLHIFEVGPDVEDTFVDISKDGNTWYSVGKVFGATSSIDIDAFGWGIADLFSYVRLTDDKAEGGTSGSTVGADIDAVGAITSKRAPPPGVPDSGSSAALIAISVLGLAGLRRKFSRP